MTQPVHQLFGCCSLVLVLLAGWPVYGQGPANKQAPIANIRVEGDSERVKVQYDALGLRIQDSVYLQVESQSRGLLNAVTVTGDIGLGLLPGRDKTAYWQYPLDGQRIDDAIRVTIKVKQADQPVTVTVSRPTALGGGPANALLSVLAPGVGSIFVQPNRKVGWRPLITGAYAGLLVYGIVEKSRSNQAYDRYVELLDEPAYDEANRRHHRYLLAIQAAAVVLVADVAYTFLKGRKNQRQRQAPAPQLVVNAMGRTPALGIQLHF